MKINDSVDDLYRCRRSWFGIQLRRMLFTFFFWWLFFSFIFWKNEEQEYCKILWNLPFHPLRQKYRLLFLYVIHIDHRRMYSKFLIQRLSIACVDASCRLLCCWSFEIDCNTTASVVLIRQWISYSPLLSSCSSCSLPKGERERKKNGQFTRSIDWILIITIGQIDWFHYPLQYGFEIRRSSEWNPSFHFQLFINHRYSLYVLSSQSSTFISYSNHSASSSECFLPTIEQSTFHSCS